MLIRVALAFLCGGVIGLERSAKNRPAGFRTHILVCIGACMASLTGHYLYLVIGMQADMTRIGANVVSGLGFICAGTIIVTRKQAVKGLTTAAGLWTTGIIGIATGSGYFEGAIAATILVLIAEMFFSRLGSHIRKPEDFSIKVEYTEKQALDHVLRACKDKLINISNLHIKADAAPDYAAFISLRAYNAVDHDELFDTLRGITGIRSVEETTG